ncbi:MAG: hypothetical protein JW827_09110 [Spirochaetes bacterium]|nr:hypothetical protein [Spirochaetota bacterium]
MTGKVILSFVVIILATAGVSALYYYILKYKFIGHFIGAFLIGLIGAVLFNYLLKSVSEFFIRNFDVNILAVILGIMISLELFHKATPH